MRLKPLTFSLLFLFSSCSYFIKLREYDNDIKVVPEVTSKSHCTNVGKTQLEIAGASSSNAKISHDVLRRIETKQRLSIIEQGVLLSLLQMNIAPHLSSPTASITLAITRNKKQEYFHFTSNPDSKAEHQYPYLYGLDYILKHYKSRLSLTTLAQLLDNNLSSFVKVDDRLESFLKNHASEILRKKELAKVFLRARQPLKKEESISRLKFSKIVKHYTRHKNAKSYNFSNELFTQVTNNGSIHCNFNIAQYSMKESEIYPVTVNSNTFAIQNRSNDVFMASSSQTIADISSILKAPIFAGTTTLGLPAVCLYSDTEKQTQMSIYSSKGRDPKQYLYNIVKGNVLQAQSIIEVYNRLSNPRTLFLANPSRIVVESQKSSPKQLDSLFQTHTPVYHAKSLGNVWIHANFPKRSIQGIVIDPRNSNSIYCH